MDRQLSRTRLVAARVAILLLTAGFAVCYSAAPASAALLPAPPMQGVKMALEPATPQYGHAYVVNDVAADPTYDWYVAGPGSTNSTSFTDYVLRTGTGSYRVWLPGLGALGVAIVSPVGGPSGVHCNVVDVVAVADRDVPGSDVVVTCFGPGGLTSPGFTSPGSPTPPASATERDTEFTFTYTYLGLTSPSGTPGPSRPDQWMAYLRATRPTSASYVPDLAYQYNSTRAQNIVERIRTGTYVAYLPSNGAPTVGRLTASVTGYGAGAHHCATADRIIADSDRVVVPVACSTADGAPIDASFVITVVAG